MNWLRILLVGLFAAESLAKTCSFNDSVALDYLADEWATAASRYPPPCIEVGDQMGETFEHKFQASAVSYGVYIMGKLYHQALNRGQELINDVERYRANLKPKIELIKSNISPQPISLDEDLNSIIKQCQVFLSLSPGNVAIPTPDLGALPAQQIIPVSRTTPRTLSELLVNCNQIFDQDFADIYGFIEGIFLTGWANARRYFGNVQAQLRGEILNWRVLNSYTQVVNDIFLHSDLIGRYVHPETWAAFNNVGQLIRTISLNCFDCNE
ncbi:uncharacterized protein LOC124410244 [Diprion similis]|uniref:uncharacterized protein LOC124410244 n=1 Tax=Diprion similis TaxID=362088 RepID=UPI001EF9015A|nr:uncharacterized protein LOC124410244 [Diprion similis]